MGGPGGRSGEDGRFLTGDGVGVHGLAGWSLVGSVEKEVGLAGEDREVVGVEGERDGFGLEVGVGLGEGLGSGLDFGSSEVSFGVEDLAVEVGKVDLGRVDEDESADSGPG